MPITKLSSSYDDVINLLCGALRAAILVKRPHKRRFIGSGLMFLIKGTRHDSAFVASLA